MAELKTKPTSTDVAAYLATLGDEQRRDSEELIGMMQRVTGDPAVMWGPSIIGFGNKHIKYESGRELDWMKIGFAARKSGMVVYCPVPLERYTKDLEKIGKHKIGKGCLYIKKLADVDAKQLELFLKKAEQNSVW